MRKTLLKCLLDYYDHIEGRVKFGTGESFTITSYDVEVIIGLTNKQGDDVLIPICNIQHNNDYMSRVRM